MTLQHVFFFSFFSFLKDMLYHNAVQITLMPLLQSFSFHTPTAKHELNQSINSDASFNPCHREPWPGLNPMSRACTLAILIGVEV
jgi:hypothetical protein